MSFSVTNDYTNLNIQKAWESITIGKLNINLTNIYNKWVKRSEETLPLRYEKYFSKEQLKIE